MHTSPIYSTRSPLGDERKACSCGSVQYILRSSVFGHDIGHASTVGAGLASANVQHAPQGNADGSAAGAAGGAANSEAQTAQRQVLAMQNKLAACQARGTCKQCHATLGRGEFWPGDWPHKHKYGGIKCMTCEPRAPGQREKYAVNGGLQGHLPRVQ